MALGNLFRLNLLLGATSEGLSRNKKALREKSRTQKELLGLGENPIRFGQGAFDDKAAHAHAGLGRGTFDP